MSEWTRLLEPKANGLARLRLKLDREEKNERWERLLSGGLAVVLMGLLGVALNLDAIMGFDLRFTSSRAPTGIQSADGIVVELPSSEPGVRLYWVVR
jgi:hypothetical protein